MKRIFVLFSICSLMFIEDISAVNNVSIDYELINDKYELIVNEGKDVLDYEKAVEKFGVEEYMQINIDGNYHYFFFGKEISKNEYDEGIQLNDLNKICDESNAECIVVETTEDLISNVEKIYNSKESNLFYLIYTSSNYKSMDFDKFNDFFEKTVIVDSKKNIYEYNDYYYISPEKQLPYYDETMVIINTLKIKTTEEEISKVDAFLDVFLKEFDGKSDYEKIMGVYTYLNNTAIYQNDDGYINFLDGQLSAYDVLIKHKAVCIGLATTFQLLMERLGIESYIVDHVSSKSDTEYITTHTYNVVKLNSEWYIVDIPLDGSLNGLLKGMSDSYSLEDFKYYDIKIADSSYLDTHKEESKDFSFDYASLLDLIEKIESNKKEDSTFTNSNGKKSYVMEYVLIAIILIVIFGVIFIFTRKK